MSLNRLQAYGEEFRSTERVDLLRFALRSKTTNGFGYLGNSGELLEDKPLELYVTCRMLHVFSMGVLSSDRAGQVGLDDATLMGFIDHGVESLLNGPLRDKTSGGWYASLTDGKPLNTRKEAYSHAFVILAASSATAASHPKGQELLDEALEISERYFWDEAQGLVVEEWDAQWQVLDSYRGLNSNMHTVEAYLAAGDVTGDSIWHERAARICSRVVEWARNNQWRIPEHFTENWEPLLEYNADQPAHPFRPYGATVGHGFEWARLITATHLTTGQENPQVLLEPAIEIMDRAYADGWNVDGNKGFIYTTDWDGQPVVHARMHWVAAEALAAASALGRVTDSPKYEFIIETCWSYVDEYLRDKQLGSWHHELDQDNIPATGTWSGKPDIYHAYQAALIQDVPVVPTFASALKQMRDS